MQLDRRGFIGATAGLVAGSYLVSAGDALGTAIDDPTSLGVADAAAAIRNGQLTATALTKAYLARIKVYEPKLNAFITLAAESAVREAEQLDVEQRAGKLRGPLHGVPLSFKDNIDTGGLRTTGGAPFFQMRVPEVDSPPVMQLRAAGAIVLGKNNLNELAMSDGRSSFYGRVRNPWSLDRETGGSSSGSCASVAARLVPAALGTDTGGSIRNPAAWCGVVGLKPTNGLVSNRGTIPLTPSLDTTGPVARRVLDAALLLNVIAGYDELDITSTEHPRQDYVAQLDQPISKLRIGLLLGHFDRMDAEVAAAMDAAIAVLKKLTDGISDAVLPDGGSAMALMPFSETYAWHEEQLKSSRYLYSSLDRATLDSLANAKASDYIRARWEMERLRRTVNNSFVNHQVMIFPTVHTVAPKLVVNPPADPDGARAPGALFDAGLFNVLGLPAISVPCGFSRDGLPIGLCMVGPRFGEGHLLAVAHAYEQATEWHRRVPQLRPDMRLPPIPTAS